MLVSILEWMCRVGMTIVLGWYLPVTRNVFQAVGGAQLQPPSHTITTTTLAAQRSYAFRIERSESFQQFLRELASGFPHRFLGVSHQSWVIYHREDQRENQGVETIGRALG